MRTMKNVIVRKPTRIDGVARLELSGGLYALIPHEWEPLQNYSASRVGSRVYAVRRRRTGGRGMTSMHRDIMEWHLGRPLLRGELVDHVNLDTLDNRTENLRLATYAQNGHNAPKRMGCSSRYKGVCFVSGKQRWRAYTHSAGRLRSLGEFQTEAEAARVSEAARRMQHGDFFRA